MMAPTRAILTILRNANIVYAVNAADWGSSIGNMPSGKGDPANFVTVRRVGDMIEDGKLMKTGLAVKFPYVQIMVRSPSAEDAEKKAEEIVAYLTPLSRVTVTYGAETALVSSIKIVTGVTFIKQEEKAQYQLYSINVQVTISEALA